MGLGIPLDTAGIASTVLEGILYGIANLTATFTLDDCAQIILRIFCADVLRNYLVTLVWTIQWADQQAYDGNCRPSSRFQYDSE